MSQPSIVTVTNQKGGVAKTTTVINTLGCLASQGKRVCGIDLDYQGNLSRSFGLKQAARKQERTISQAIENDLKLGDVRMKTAYENIDLVCADLALVYEIQKQTGRPRQASLIKRFLDCKEIEEYDVILIDTHPSPDCLFQSAIAASHYYCIPVFAEPDPLEGVHYMIELIDEVKEEHNPNLTFLGILITRYLKKNKTHERFQPMLRDFAKRRNFNVFSTVIPQSEAVAAASAAQVPLVLDPVKKTLPVASAYLQFTNELLPQLKGKRQGRKPHSPNFTGAEVLDDAFSGEFDFVDSNAQVDFEGLGVT